ncbi:MAG: Gfo/Idh/MocA family oxidoreductase [Ignavibacteriae bacterium]|nr:Gfo/Idh/MocA family oxidoreductase [Ignavibacteriota bacterium]
MKKIKVSVIGSGHLGSIHTKLWKSTPDSELLGIFDIDSERAAKVANENDIKVFETIDDAIQSSDAVTISAPTTFHYEIAEKCIESGVHCLIEKPITSTYDEAKKLIAQAKNKNLVIQVGHVERFNPALLAIKNYQLNPMFIEAHRLSQFKPRAIDVSVILDLMIHDIDIMLWLVKSKVEKIDANGVAVLTDTPDIANARIKFENGAVANLTASRISANPMRKLRMFQSNAYISIDFGNQDVEVFRLLEENESAGGNAIPANMLGTLEAGLKNKKIVFEKPVVPEINAIAEEQKAFIEAIINGLPAAVSAEEAAEALRIAELIAEQIK